MTETNSTQTGVEPRVLIFSLQNGSSDIPLAILNGHCFGVSAIAFSPDGKYLASLGLPQDGFLYVWSINQRTGAAKLHSSGKCITNIRQMLWLRNSVITQVPELVHSRCANLV
jgi:WD40 repeat protein